MNNSAIPCCDCQCSCHDNRVLRGWQAISEWAHKVNLPIGRSPSQLRRYAQNMGFPTWVNRYGRICLFPRHGIDWFINFQSRNDWWPNGRPGRKGRAWEEHRSELMDRMDEARAFSITPPERCFEAARKKIGAGHYDFDADNTEKQTDRSQQ